MDRAARISLASWMGRLWNDILFPGPSPIPVSSIRSSTFLLLLVLPAMLLYPCLGFHLFEPDESRYAQIPREMLEAGEWLVPTLQGEPYLDKPPLFYWMVMLSYRVFGYHDWAARLVPALAVHLTILLTWFLGRRTLGERSALAGALALTLAPGFLGMSRLLLLDGVLTFFVALALFAAFEAVRTERFLWSWWLLASTACGLAVLTKGPVALILLVPPLFLYRRLTGRGTPAGISGWTVFTMIVLAICLPWYVALSWKIPGFVRYFFWEHNLQRFLAPGVHVRGVWFYLPVLALVMFPVSLLLLPVGRFYLSSDEGVSTRRTPELGFHFLAGGWCVAFFTLSSCKLPTYILPGVPFLALMFGHALVNLPRPRPRLLQMSAAMSFLLLAMIHYVALPWYAWYRSPMSRPAEVLRLCADRSLPVVCYPRNCDSVAFYLGRSDLKTYRSKDIEDLRTLVRLRPRTVILCTHRHSLQGLKELLPPEVTIVHEVRMGLRDIPGVPPWLMKPLAKLMGETALGLCDLAVIEMPRLLPQQAKGPKPPVTGEAN